MKQNMREGFLPYWGRRTQKQTKLPDPVINFTDESKLQQEQLRALVARLHSEIAVSVSYTHLTLPTICSV